MFNISEGDNGVIILEGRLDAAAAALARDFLDKVEETRHLDFSHLDYIASIGLGILASTQRRLLNRGSGLILTGLNPHLKEVFTLAGFQGVFQFE